jgi:hypothetical protein
MAANHRDQIGEREMKKTEVKIGGIYYANVSGKKTRVRIDSEASSGGWSATNLETDKGVRIKTAQRLLGVARAKGSAQTTTDGNLTVVEVPPAEVVSIEPSPRTTKRTKPKREDDTPKKLSALSAAARVLGESDEPLSVKQMVEQMSEKRYWSSPGGKTPHATLYSAILREIAGKEELSRFVKTDRGRFIAANLEGATR